MLGNKGSTLPIFVRRVTLFYLLTDSDSQTVVVSIWLDLI